MRLVVLTIVALSAWLSVSPATPPSGKGTVHTSDGGTPIPPRR